MQFAFAFLYEENNFEVITTGVEKWTLLGKDVRLSKGKILPFHIFCSLNIVLHLNVLIVLKLAI